MNKPFGKKNTGDDLRTITIMEDINLTGEKNTDVGRLHAQKTRNPVLYGQS